MLEPKPLKFRIPPNLCSIDSSEKINYLVQKASTKVSKFASDIRLRGRIQQFLMLKENKFDNYLQENVKIILEDVDEYSKIAQEYVDINSVEWSKDCERAYSRTPSLLDKILTPKPEFYKERLIQVKESLIKCENSIELIQISLDRHLDALSLGIFVFEVCEGKNTERLGTLVQVQQTGLMTRGAIDLLSMSVQNQLDMIHGLINVTIPNWMIAHSLGYSK